MTSPYTPVPLLQVDERVDVEHAEQQEQSVSPLGLSVRRVLPLAVLLAAALGIYQITTAKKIDTLSKPGTLKEHAVSPSHDDAQDLQFYEVSEDSTLPPPMTTTLWQPTSVWGWLWVLVVTPDYFAGDARAHKAVAKTVARILGLPWWLVRVWLRPRGGWGRALLGQSGETGSVDVEFMVDAPPGTDLQALADKETNSDVAVDTVILNEELTTEGCASEYPDSKVKETKGSPAVGGIAACSGHNFTKQECGAVGCCKYDDKEKICYSAVGTQLCTPTPSPCETTTPAAPPCDTTQAASTTPAAPPCDTTQAASTTQATSPYETTKQSLLQRIFR